MQYLSNFLIDIHTSPRLAIPLTILQLASYHWLAACHSSLHAPIIHLSRLTLFHLVLICTLCGAGLLPSVLFLLLRITVIVSPLRSASPSFQKPHPQLTNPPSRLIFPAALWSFLSAVHLKSTLPCEQYSFDDPTRLDAQLDLERRTHHRTSTSKSYPPAPCFPHLHEHPFTSAPKSPASPTTTPSKLEPSGGGAATAAI